MSRVKSLWTKTSFPIKQVLIEERPREFGLYLQNYTPLRTEIYQGQKSLHKSITSWGKNCSAPHGYSVFSLRFIIVCHIGDPCREGTGVGGKSIVSKGVRVF